MFLKIDKKVGIIFGTWDFLHPGHLYALTIAKQNCDFLIAGLLADPSIERLKKNKPVETLFERWVRLKACDRVDQIIPYSTEYDIFNILTTLYPDIQFLSEEYKGKHITAQYLAKDIGVEHFYIPRKHLWSSSELRNRRIEID